MPPAAKSARRAGRAASKRELAQGRIPAGTDGKQLDRRPCGLGLGDIRGPDQQLQ